MAEGSGFVASVDGHLVGATVGSFQDKDTGKTITYYGVWLSDGFDAEPRKVKVKDPGVHGAAVAAGFGARVRLAVEMREAFGPGMKGKYEPVCIGVDVVEARARARSAA